MASELGSFCASPLGAFVASPLGARDCEEPSGLPSGCCCHTWQRLLPHPRGWYWDRLVSWGDWTGPWYDDWPDEGDTYIYETVLECDSRHRVTDLEDDSGCRRWASRQTHALPWPGVLVFSPFCTWPGLHGTCLSGFWLLRGRRITHAGTNDNMFASWRAPCLCEAPEEDPNAPPDTEERCSHEEGICCALVLGHWELLHEGRPVWARYCNAAAQQNHFTNPIQDIHFDPNPDDPESPCPDDPAGDVRGWCCVIMLDGRVFHANPLGEGGNTREDECTFAIQEEVFADINPELVVVGVNWIGEVGTGCNPCGVPEGACCLWGQTFVEGKIKGGCITGVTEAECDGFFDGVFTPRVGGHGWQCSNCFTPEPLPDIVPWLGPEGRCCTTYQFFDGARWIDIANCSVLTSSGCGQFRKIRRNDPDRYRDVVGEPWTIGYNCAEEPDAGETPQERRCNSEQGWCCTGGQTGDATWRTRWECEHHQWGGTFYDARTDPNQLCSSLQPCCLPDEDGTIGCEMHIRSECLRLGGKPMGELGDTCTDIECEAGACCLGCNRCVDNITPWDCAAIELHPDPFPYLGGIYKGHGTHCFQTTDCPNYDLQQGPP